MTSFISSLEIINVAKLDPEIFLLIAPSIGDAAAVNPNVTKTLLANGLSIFPIKGNPIFNNGPKSGLVFNNGPKSLPKILLIVLFNVMEFLIFYISWGTVCKSFRKIWNLSIS